MITHTYSFGWMINVPSIGPVFWLVTTNINNKDVYTHIINKINFSINSIK